MSGIDFLTVKSDILRAAEVYHDAVKRGWSIASDDERDAYVGAAHRMASAELGRLRVRFHQQLSTVRARLVYQAFTPRAGSTADRTVFDDVLATAREQITDINAAFRAINDPTATPTEILAVLRVAWDQHWRDVLVAYRARTEDIRWRGLSPLGALLDLEHDLKSSGLDSAAAFDLPALTATAASAN